MELLQLGLLGYWPTNKNASMYWLEYIYFMFKKLKNNKYTSEFYFNLESRLLCQINVLFS